MPGGYVCSGSMKHAMGTTEVKEAVAGTLPLRKLVLEGAARVVCRA